MRKYIWYMIPFFILIHIITWGWIFELISMASDSAVLIGVLLIGFFIWLNVVFVKFVIKNY